MVCPAEFHLGEDLGQTDNRDDFLSLDLGLRTFAEVSDAERLRRYRQIVYDIGTLPGQSGALTFQLTRSDRFQYRTRHFTDSGVIGGKAFVARCYAQLEDHFSCRHTKPPRPIKGLDNIYSLKRLRGPG